MHSEDRSDVIVDLPQTGVPLAQWRTQMAQIVAPLQIAAHEGIPFRGHMQHADVDGVRLLHLSATAHTVTRQEGSIRETDPKLYKLSLQLSGHALLTQDGRSARLHAGDLAVYDTHRPYTLTFPEPSQTLVMVIPQSRIGLTPQQVSLVTAFTFCAGHGLARMVNPFLVELGRNIDQLCGAYAARLVHAALDLTETMLSQAVQESPQVRGSSTSSLSQEIREHILENLHDSQMTPASIAATHFISLRYLYTLFAEDGDTVSAWIRSRRLERIRRDLTDPLLQHRPVSWIAAQWGLLDAAHFSRLFKAHYGESPGQCRRRHLGHQLAAG
ncbi:helix-turn-helix domain-containing protein [Nesterenkonia rhizosphaerae]|uniref:HTH araC/xylS-type domain-containing protein n=1 Tax=Nesterenkonia rhizosphaerae TaxID=1348272 RepID=A0ABP9FQ84_9MICC